MLAVVSLLWTPGGGAGGIEGLSGSLVEIVNLERHGEGWDVTAAVDGVKYQPWWESNHNVESLTEDELLAYLKEQAVGWADYCKGQTV
jgi:hypothetical protein